jgi:Cys-tRNA(Pro) deacylase
MPDKLNSMRLLESRKIPYIAKTYDVSGEFHSATEAAALIGAAVEAVYKTLVVLREPPKSGKPILVMIASPREVELKLLAKSLDEKKLRMATQREAESLTGLQVGGISALALINRGFEVCIDQPALALDQIHISAGQRGVDLQLAVKDLIAVTSAKLVCATESAVVDGKRIVREGYDQIAEEYLLNRSEDSDDVKLLQELVERLPKHSRVLDAGCGAGVPICEILSRHFQVVGVDFSEAQIKLARQFVPQAEFICEDMTALKFPDAAFDAIVSYYAIIHVPREEYAQLLRNFWRMLKPGGLALLAMGRGDTAVDVNENWLGAKMYWSHYDSETNLKLIESSGLHVLWTKVVADHLDVNASHFFVLAQKA